MDSLNAHVTEMISQLTAITPDEIKPDMRLREDLGMDSVSSMELLSMIAEEYDLDIDSEEALEVTTVAGVVEMVRGHLDN
ncbi:MAG: hypothetical protein JXX28_10305 [Deltaproteobacteria bacterium]|nr:hypothetical protein [Deltaproteobacteria bacterium]